MAGTVDRRKFLAAAGVTGITAAVAGVAGELMLCKHARANSPASSMATPAPMTSAPASAAPPAKIEIAAMQPLPPGAELNIAGLSPFYTPNADFYRVDTALVTPRVSAASWQLRIHGMVDEPVTITFDDLIRRPMVEHDITLTCVSEAVGGNFIGNAHWQGVLLADLLR